MNLLLLNGPNLNLLGTREPEIYGRETLSDIEQQCRAKANLLSINLDCKQSNHEGELVNWVQDAREKYSGIIINPAGYSHTSIALRDALSAVEIPIIEVHLSNIFAREEFRHFSYISPIAKGGVFGLGSQGYLLAIDAMYKLLSF